MNNDRIAPWFITALILVSMLYRFNLAASLPLTPDEAYYANWSDRLQAGYFDHPPGVALVIKISRIISVNIVPWARDRMPALGAYGIASASIYCWTREMTGTSGAMLASAAFASTLLFSLGSIIVTPDTPFLIFWLAASYAAWRIAIHDKTSGYKGALLWVLLGLTGGLGLVSKYTMALYLPAVTAGFLLAGKALWLKHPAPWIAVVFAGAVFSPVVWWNYKHDWISLSFQTDHAFGGNSYSLKYFWELLGGQLAVITPLLGVILVIAAIYAWRYTHGEISAKTSEYGNIKEEDFRNGLKMLFCLWAVPMMFFIWSSLSGRVEANWPAAAWISLYPVLGFWSETTRRRRNVTVVAIFSSAVISAIVLYHAGNGNLNLSPRIDRTNDTLGWIELAHKVSEIQSEQSVSSEKSGERKPFIITTAYGLAAELEYHFRINGLLTEPVFQLDGAHRYSNWPEPSEMIGRNALFVYAVDLNEKYSTHEFSADDLINTKESSVYKETDYTETDRTETEIESAYLMKYRFQHTGKLWSLTITRNDKPIKRFFIREYLNFKGSIECVPGVDGAWGGEWWTIGESNPEPPD